MKNWDNEYRFAMKVQRIFPWVWSDPFKASHFCSILYGKPIREPRARYLKLSKVEKADSKWLQV